MKFEVRELQKSDQAPSKTMNFPFLRREPSCLCERYRHVPDSVQSKRGSQPTHGGGSHQTP